MVKSGSLRVGRLLDVARASQVNALHAIQVRTEEVIEQIQVIDAVLAKPFVEASTH